MRARENGKKFLILVLCVSIILFFWTNSHAKTSSNPATKPRSLSPTGSGGSISGDGNSVGSPTPDLFTGTMSYSIPIEVPAGRKGMEPNLALTYRSNNENGWVGVGWDLNVGAIERNTTHGIDYTSTSTDFILRLGGSAINLIYDSGSSMYRAKIEGIFINFTATTDGQGNIVSWMATDKTGKQYYYGETAGTRQDHSTNVFKWCLDKVIDTNGNFMTFSYFKDQGQIYLARIDYTGNNAVAPTNYVIFYSEPRTDELLSYSTNFKVTTAYKLNTIDINNTSGRIRAYALTYTASANTSYSLLSSIQQFDKNVTVTNGVITAGTPLPATNVAWYDSTAIFVNEQPISSSSGLTQSQWSADGHRAILGDFNGDGNTGILLQGATSSSATYLLRANGSGGFQNAINVSDSSGLTQAQLSADHHIAILGDFNGDGITDILLQATTSSGGTYLLLGNGSGGFQQEITLSGTSGLAQSQWSADGHRAVLGDFDGDGNTDILLQGATGSGATYLLLANGNGNGRFQNEIDVSNKYGLTQSQWSADGHVMLTGDFNGDGRTDILLQAATSSGGTYLLLANGSGGFQNEITLSGTSGLAQSQWSADGHRAILRDFNGDGRTDILLQGATSASATYLLLSNGSGGFQNEITLSGTSGLTQSQWSADGHIAILGDFNGDGRTDILLQGATSSGATYLLLANGSGGFQNEITLSGTSGLAQSQWSADGHVMLTGDFNGDGNTDILLQATTSSGNAYMVLAKDIPFNFMQTISNGIGGATTITYTPSTQYVNPRLPFPVKTVSSVTSCDNYNTSANTCNGNSSPTEYTYSGGYYHIGEQDFRGFNYAKVTDPAGNNTETWFHQGDDTSLISENTTTADLISLDTVPAGYMKGKPYRVRISDASGAVYTETTTIYSSGTGTAPYFNPPLQTDIYSCDGKLGASCVGNTSAQHIQTIVNAYDQYGNVTSQYQSGNMNDPSDTSARTISRTYLPNTTAWILSLPASETIYSAVTGSKVASTSYYYDGITTCTTASSGQPPTKGNSTCIARWVDGVTDPSVGMTYDNYGNLASTRDAKGYIATLTFDGTSTFLKTATDPLGHQTITQYYSGAPTDAGLYGQVQSVTDPNGAVTTITYDTFGRKQTVTNPDLTWTSWTYPITPGTGSSTNVYGAIGTQNIEIDTSASISSWTYFDGLGRTIVAKKTGPNGSKIVTQTQYNPTGTVAQTSLPYFDGGPSQLVSYTYDPMGRTVRVDNPDGTSVSSCYNNGITLVIDADQHFKRATKNAQGKLVKVEEFSGTLSSCPTDPANITGVTLYATTTYAYDMLGNLLTVTDAKNNLTQMQYDPLGRKTYMSDPDMGVWHYSYDPNGNLLTQTDAKGQPITFSYDALNRVYLKHYPTGTDVTYMYDVKPDASTTVTYPVGRRSTMTDASGTTKYFYDVMGRTSTTKKTVDGTEYAITSGYDNGRLSSIQYPDNETVSYGYDGGGNLSLVSSPTVTYAAYSGYNAQGQTGNVTYGNNVVTQYQFKPENNRLINITTSNATQALLNLTYDYWNNGNIKSITDGIDANRTQTFTYDEQNRLVSAQSTSFGPQPLSYVYDEIGNILSKEGIIYDQYGLNAGPHAVTRTFDGQSYTSYSYDPNGNMFSDGTKTIVYDYDNMPQSVSDAVSGATTTFVYDGSGARVEKITPTATTVYIGKLYECRGGACSKYIFAGGTRVALHTPTDILYYHQDHLGSSSIITNAGGTNVEEIYYYPFGATRVDTGAPPVEHAYTSQEFDAETGLYYYNARYYNPALGRFISADTIVPGVFDPQALNRYAYVANDPVNLIDPTGMFADLGSMMVAISLNNTLSTIATPSASASILGIPALPSEKTRRQLVGLIYGESGTTEWGGENSEEKSAIGATVINRAYYATLAPASGHGTCYNQPGFGSGTIWSAITAPGEFLAYGGGMWNEVMTGDDMKSSQQLNADIRRMSKRLHLINSVSAANSLPSSPQLVELGGLGGDAPISFNQATNSPPNAARMERIGRHGRHTFYGFLTGRECQ